MTLTTSTVTNPTSPTNPARTPGEVLYEVGGGGDAAVTVEPRDPNRSCGFSSWNTSRFAVRLRRDGRVLESRYTSDTAHAIQLADGLWGEYQRRTAAPHC